MTEKRLNALIAHYNEVQARIDNYEKLLTLGEERCFTPD